MAEARYKQLQMRIVELLSDCEVEHRHLFVEHPK
jgi:hypothetical protein